MASCKECIHFDRCKGLYKFDRLQKAVSKGCSYFKDRSRFVELPCDIISKAEIKRELSAQCAVKKIDVETAKDMLENLPYIRVNTKQELKERETIPNNITPEAAIIELNHIRTDKDERPPEIDMAITAINRCMVKRKPDLNIHDDPLCPNCRAFVEMFTGEFCPECGQALDWSEPKCKT